MTEEKGQPRIVNLAELTGRVEIEPGYHVELPDTEHFVIVAGANYPAAATHYDHPNVAARQDKVFYTRAYWPDGRKKWFQHAGTDFSFVVPRNKISLVFQKGYSYVPVVINGQTFRLSVTGGTFDGWTAIRPSTELRAILPPQTRHRVWKRLQQEAQGRLRGLRLPFRLGPVLAGGCLVAGVIAAVMIMPLVGFVHAMVLVGTALVAMLLVTFVVTRPFALVFPHGVATVGDAARATLPPGYEVAVKQQMTDEEIWLKLQKIVADILGVKVEKVTPSARFVEDLRAG